MASARKRPRPEIDESSRAECPFTVRLVDPKEKDAKGKKRRKRESTDEGDGAKKILNQLSPFAPSGRLRTYDTLDVHYAVDPPKRWSEMTRYNSFVLNGVKYHSEGFIYIANESTIERQKDATRDPMQPRKKSDDEWVARILEIRASDEHHVYARVYWMYWPDELPPGTYDGKKAVQGRQSYHGNAELIASNHMDIINVVSVTSQAQVNQMIEDNDDDIQNALYWRQALDVRTMELSTVEAVCKCGQPANPDKTLIGCTAEGCTKWLHDECLRHEHLMKTFERLGKDKPHRKSADLVKEEKDGEEPKRPLSPTESGAAMSAEQSIDVKADVDGEGVKVNDNVEVKRLEEEGADSNRGESERKSESAPVAPNSARKPGRPKKKHDSMGPDSKNKPYEGLFEAAPRMDLTPPQMEITDLREGVEGGEKSWLEPIHCLVCGAQVH